MSEVIGKADFSAYNYQSPIELIADKVRMEQDEYVVKCVQKMGVNVDKNELIRALQYDRGQYDKGFSDGRMARDSEIVRCRNCKWYRTEYGWNCAEYTVCGISPTYHPIRSDNDFCSFGERKEVEK